MNFDNHLFSCSSLSNLMSGLKDNLSEYLALEENKNSILESFSKAQEAYEAIKNKETQTAKKKEESIGKWAVKYDEITAQMSLIDKDAVTLSDGAQTHLIDIYVACTKNRPSRDVKSKYIEKGVMLEEKAISLYSKVKGQFFEKCLERKDDGFIMGEVDIDEPEFIIDTKVSWDIWTFYRNLKYIKNPRSNPYYPNMQGYMKLWDKPKSVVAYCLLDTPKVLLDAELRKLAYTLPESMYEEAAAELEKNLTYSDLDIHTKILEVTIERDEEYIALIPKAVTAARKFLNNVKDVNYEQQEMAQV